MSSSSRRKIGVLLVAAVLLAPWSAAAATGASKEPSGSRSPWVLLARLWSAVTFLWDDNGCGMDPFGQCGAANSAPTPTENLDNGCSVDPYGGGCR